MEESRMKRVARLRLAVALGTLAVLGCDTDRTTPESIGNPIWTADSRSLDVTCGSFWEGSMRFVANRDELTAEQLAQLSNLRLVESAPTCLQDGRGCRILVTDADGQTSSYGSFQDDSVCGPDAPQAVVPFAAFDPFRRGLPCRYALPGQPVNTTPLGPDGRCFNGMFASYGGATIALTLEVATAETPRHIELDDCDQPGRAGALAFTVLDADGATVLATGSAPPAPGPNHTCVSATVTFPRAGQFPLNVTVAPAMLAGDFSLRFY
jgi:hypothetical protein